MVPRYDASVRVALTRPVSTTIADCELTFLDREPIDAARAAAQHEEYEQCLAERCRVERLPAAPDLPDAVFVEDTAVVLDEIAIITRPGAESRQAETQSVESALQRYRPLSRIHAPGTLDGGDILLLDHTIYAGRSRRTNDIGIAQLRELAQGYDVVPVPFGGCLHLKSAVTRIGDRALLVNPEWVDSRLFAGFEPVAVDPREPHGANALRLDEIVLLSDSHPRTRQALERRGYRIETVDVSELEKAEAGVTCCSIIVEV
jgi:dimethylargininase